MTTPFLVFQLYGPMASWGEVAVGEERDSAAHPSRSAVLGLCAAALGITRAQEKKVLALHDSLGFAVCVDEPGDILRDYHTVQAPRGKRARDLPTRRDEIAYGNLDAILSKRHYRTDAFYTVCLWCRDDEGPFTLEELASALRTPQFSPFLGRKACPPSLPFAPQIISAPTILRAIQTYDAGANQQIRRLLTRLKNSSGELRNFFWDADTAGVEPGLDAIHIAKRWDRLISRDRWQFARRDEAFARAPRQADKEVN